LCKGDLFSKSFIPKDRHHLPARKRSPSMTQGGGGWAKLLLLDLPRARMY
jgi:hypothetical protein